MLKVALHHRSHYHYDRPVQHAPHLVRLRPAPHCRTAILSYALRVLPAGHFLNWQQDPFSNYVGRLVFPEKTTELLVEVDLVAEMAVYNPFDFFIEDSAQLSPFRYEPALQKQLAPFLEAAPAGPLLTKLIKSSQPVQLRTIDFLVGLNRRLSTELRYVIRLEAGVQSPEDTLQTRSGSCRDSSWLLVQLFRHLGVAARFVSGYLIQLQPDVKSLDGPSGAAADFTDLHAWCEVFVPGAGWVGLDPTSGLLAGEGHIPLACTPEPSSAAPISGAVDPCESKFEHTMTVRRSFESARVTKPYTEKQWSQIEAMGHAIDADLIAGDVRLTMGGEPTFISIDNMDGAEWNFTALSTEKRQLAGDLIRRLKQRFAPGGLLHYGQGKWYPGEPLPRWALSCYWRKDGHPIWNNEALCSLGEEAPGHTVPDAHRFITRLASILNLDPQFALPAFEDTYYHLWRERQLPTNVDPLKSDLKQPDERARLAQVLSAGLNEPIGYVLPLQRKPGTQKTWASDRWGFRGGHLYLIPGDSPIGLRLPLDSLPWVPKTEYPTVHPPDPSAIFPALGTPSSTNPRAVEVKPAPLSDLPPLTPALAPLRGEGEDGAQPVRTALCVEAREGRLHVFMPPVSAAEDYLELLAAIEKTAQELALPVVLEGSTPPIDPRLQYIKVTPDPGVIEVNLHPASNWNDLVQVTTALYEDARQARLATEKFMLDGRHIGTGGGNHIVIGGPSTADSPILRRPDLLRSLLTYWQHHPALSFLFSGLFIGPTSQHPRIDEARHDSLYELEIAFRQIPDQGTVSPWLVDRLFRHLLVDLTGNTHRAEFCIDKLFAPESSTGRLGLVELRAFEMPPHAQMSLTQQLLLRALIARFWKLPYRRPLVPWGSQLHDRFMLPHFIAQDVTDMVDDLNEHGYAFELPWFAPHLEFRFPLYGTVTHGGVQLELRQALEPWHVLGEDGGTGGTARYVDSSLERLQVKITGFIPARHVVSCNGRALPLHPTGVGGEYVAGVRFRAWQPPECLHPTIKSHAPLTFDIVDRWNGRSLGGCVYHVAHPGGLNYTTLPVNAYEAESRRLTRFSRIGHTPGRMEPPSASVSSEFPFTLDLRQS